VLQNVTLIKIQLIDQKNAPEFVHSNTVSSASISYPRLLIRVSLKTFEDARILLKNYHGSIEVFADRCGVDPASPVRSDRRFNYLRTGALFEKGEPVTTSLDDITPNFGVLRPEDEIDRYYSIFLDAKKIKFDKPYDLCLMLVGGTL